MNWRDFWNRENSIYVNDRHRALHDERVARDIAALIDGGFAPTAAATVAGLFGWMQLPGRLLMTSPRFTPSPAGLVVFSFVLQVIGLGALIVHTHTALIAGVLLLCFVPSLAVRTAALGICGLGSGPLYPLTVDRFYVRIGDRLDSTTLSAYCALASGAAITVGPLALGVLADTASLRWAVLVVPALAVVALATQRPAESAG